MEGDAKLNSQQQAWRNLPGMERVPSLPKKPSTDIHTKLLLENEAAWVSIANLFKECGMEKNVCYAYERALANNPMSYDALSGIGPIYRRSRKFAAALDVFLRLYKLSNGEDMLCAANIAFCYLMLDGFVESLAWYRLAARYSARIKEGKGFLWYGIGVFYERLNNLQTAEEAYASAIKIDIAFDYVMETYFRLGVAYKRRGAVQTAMECFEYLVMNQGPQHLSPSKEDVLIQIAHVHEMQSREQEAMDMLKDICQVNPRHEKALMLLSWLFYKEKNWVLSKDTLTMRLPRDSISAFSWYMIGRCEQKLERYEEAYRCYSNALKKDQVNHVYWNTIGTLYFALQQFEDALNAFKRAEEINPQYMEAIYNQGVVYEQFEGTLDMALEVYERAQEIFSDDKLSIERIDEIEGRKACEDEKERYAPPDLALRDITPNPTKTPYFMANALLGNKPTSFVFTPAEKHGIDEAFRDLNKNEDPEKTPGA